MRGVYPSAAKSSLRSLASDSIACLGPKSRAPVGQAVTQAGKDGEVKIVAFDAEPETQRCMEEGAVQAMIGQRVYFYGYLSGYVMDAMAKLGEEEVMAILDPYLDELGDEGKIRLNTGVDVIKADTFDQYKEYLDSIGIPSQ